MSAAEQLRSGQEILDSRGITLNQGRQAVWDTWPDSKFDRSRAECVAAAEARSWSTTPQPHTVEAVARHIAKESGAFPWEGPVRNGLTVAKYQAHLRRIAADHIAMWQRLGLDPQGYRHE